MANIFSLYKYAFTGLQPSVWILSCATFINRSGSMVLLFAALYFTNVLDFSISTAGFIMSFYGIGSVLGSYFGGWITDKKSFYDIMIISLSSSGIILLLLLLVTSPYLLALVIFSYAFASDMFRPANAAAIAAYSSVENRTRSVSMVRLAINMGFSIGPAIGGFIALYAGYHWLFVIDSLTSISAAILLYHYLPRPNKNIFDRKELPVNTKSLSAYHDRRYLFFILMVVFYGICFFQMFVSIPQYFNKVCNYTEGTIGLLMGLNGLLVVIIEMPLMAALEKQSKIFRYMVLGALLIPISFSALIFGKGILLWAIVYIFFITLSEIFAMPFMMNYSLSRPQKHRQGQYSALYSIAYGLALIIAPVVGLGIAELYGFDFMFIFFSLLGVITAVGFMILNHYQPTKA